MGTPETQLITKTERIKDQSETLTISTSHSSCISVTVDTLKPSSGDVFFRILRPDLNHNASASIHLSAADARTLADFITEMLR